MGHVVAQGELQSLSAEIERLQTLNTEQLDERWRELFGAARPRRIYGVLLIGALAYRLQEKTLGGLRPATRRVLRQVAGAPAERRPIPALSKPRLQVGAVVLREWHGTTHRVTVLEEGFQYGKQPLAVRSGAGDHRQPLVGPAFFGLKAAAKEQTDANA